MRVIFSLRDLNTGQWKNTNILNTYFLVSSYVIVTIEHMQYCLCFLKSQYLL